MAKPVDLTPDAALGYDGVAVDFLYTSPVHSAWALGQHLRQTGRPKPADVHMGRGDSIWADGVRFRIDYSSVKFPRFERIA